MIKQQTSRLWKATTFTLSLRSQYNLHYPAQSLLIIKNYNKQSNQTYGKDFSHSKISRNVQDDRRQSFFFSFTRQKDQGKPETSVACPFVLICLKHRTETLPAHCWPVSSKKVSNITTSVIASTEYSYALWEPKDLRRRTDRQDTPKCKTNTLNQLYYNTETQWSEDTHIWSVLTIALVSTY